MSDPTPKVPDDEAGSRSPKDKVDGAASVSSPATPDASDAQTPSSVAPTHPHATTTVGGGDKTLPRPGWPQIDGYQIEEVLGHGGMGVVYRARQLKLNRQVALKTVLAGAHASPDAISRFLVEAEAVAGLQHPHIVQLFDLGELSGQPYFAMEYVDGGHLAQRVAENPLGFREAAEMVERISRAVQYAHDCGVVHRDLKPANVLLTRDGVPKITDFGIAKRMDSNAGLTATGAVLGTPAYLSPEQAAGKTKEIGPPTDIYALGVVFYELLTGRRPFDSDSDMQVIQQVLNQDPPSPAWLRPSVPRDLETICLKCLEKDPLRRYVSAGALADDLRRYLRGEPIVARRISSMERGVRWVRRRPATATFVALALLAAMFGGRRTWQYLAYERETEQLYQSFSVPWDVVEGIGRISADEAQHRYVTYRLVRNGFKGSVQRVEAINGSGALHTDRLITDAIDVSQTASTSQPACRLEYERDSAGKLVRQNAFDRAGRLLWSFQYSTPTYGYYLDDAGNPRARSGSGAVGTRLTYSPEGHRLKTEFCDINGDPQPNDQASFGTTAEYDERGLQVRVTNLGPDGKSALHRDGYVTLRQSFDDNGYPISTECLDEHGKPATVKGGYSRISAEYDAYGNAVAYEYFDTHGRPTAGAEGYARKTLAYDSYGNRTEERYWDAEGHPATAIFGYSRWTAEYDARGNRISVAYWGADEQPAVSKEGYAKYSAKYDEAGNQTELSYFGTDGKPTLHPDGYARTTSRFDAQGYLTDVEYFDKEGKPTRNRSGCARMTCKWRKGRLEEFAYFDMDGKPTPHPDGNVRRTARFDPHGNQLEENNFGANGERVNVRDGYASWTAEYDRRGNCTKMLYFDAEGKPALRRDGYAGWTATYDDRGNELKKVFLGADGQPTITPEGFSSTVTTYDQRGNQTKLEYFGLDGKPTLHRNGTSAWTAEYDERGMLLKMTFLDRDGRLLSQGDGIVQFELSYDALGNLVDRLYLGPDGKPTLHREGNAQLKSRFDHRGNEIERAFYGPDDRLVLLPDGSAGWTAEFDNRGRQLAIHYFGLKREPVTNVDGYASWSSIYDDRGNQIEIAYFGVDGKPTARSLFYALATASYDVLGRKIAEANYDEHRQPVLNANGVFRGEYEYDQHGNITRESYFGPDGKRVVNHYGVSGIERQFDAQSRVVRESFLGVNDEPVANHWGIMTRRCQYDNRGNQLQERYLGADGNPQLNSQGIAGWNARHDSRGNMIDQEFFGIERDTPADSFAGYSRTVFEYNDRSQAVNARRFNAAGSPVVSTDEGWHQKKLGYDARGNVVEEAYFGIDGKPITTQSGFARTTSQFDHRNLVQRKLFFDTAGQQVATQVVVVQMYAGGRGEFLRAGDVLTRYDGADITDSASFVDRRKLEFDVHQPHVLELTRGKEKMTFDVLPGQLNAVLTDVVREKSPAASTP